MSSEEEQIEQRRVHLSELGQLGLDRYPHRFDRSATISDLVHAHGSKTGPELEGDRVETITSGRILGNRSFGKANFLVISDGRSKIQAYIKKDTLPERDFRIFQLLDIGDVIGVEGHLFRTRTNELTIWASRLEFLAKCHLPLPEKWHGLTDVEIRYRQRYLDLIVNPEAREVFQVRSKVLTALREFLDARGYLEVETPMMQPVAGGAIARPFKTHHNALDMDLYLRIAPELYLKRLVVGGFERVYEINRNFRNEGVSTQHNPEFTMLEFYQAYADYQDLMELTEELFTDLAQSLLGRLTLRWGEHAIDLARPWKRLPFFSGVSAALGTVVTVETDAATVARAAAAKGVSVKPGAAAWEVWKEVFDELVQPTLVQPTFVVDYPIELSPLAKKKRDNPRLVDRFELFVATRELANAYSELNDPVDQLARFREQAAQKARGDDEAHWLDEDYVRALEYGMPPAAGEGIGIDRLTLPSGHLPSIREGSV